MAKSEGNFVTIHELLRDWPGEVLRLNMLRTHYRQPIDWTVKGLEESRKRARPLACDRRRCRRRGRGDNPLLAKVLEPLLDDLNTPLAIAAMHQMAGEVADDHEGEDRAHVPRGAEAARAAAGRRSGMVRLAARRGRRSTRGGSPS